jgi:hypothetical protein
MILPYFRQCLSSQIIPVSDGFDRENRDGHGSQWRAPSLRFPLASARWF